MNIPVKMLSGIIKFRLGEGWGGSIWNGKWPGKSRKVNFFTPQKAKIRNSFLEAISLFLELGKHPTNVFTRTSPSSPPPLVNIWILTNTAKKCCFSKELGLPWTTKFKVGILLRKLVQSAYLNHIFVLAVLSPWRRKEFVKVSKKRKEGGRWLPN